MIQLQKHVTTVHSVFKQAFLTCLIYEYVKLTLFLNINVELENTLLYHQKHRIDSYVQTSCLQSLCFSSFSFFFSVKNRTMCYQDLSSFTKVIVIFVFISSRSCFELLLSVPENEIPYEAWVQFHHSVQVENLISKTLFADGLYISILQGNKVGMT